MDREVNIDRRVKKTRQVLKDALISLMAEKDFSNITVQDITRVADVNRATFYSHYHDKIDLIQKIAEEILNELNAILMKKSDGLRSYDLLVQIFEHLSEHSEFYTIMLSSNRFPGFWKKLYAIFRNATSRSTEFSDSDDSIPQDILNSYILGAYFGVVIQWIKRGMPYSPKYMAEKLANIKTVI
ncbi:TetR/AcrR family transcriptional regulator C-terminal domain-containing protein [Lysinibacillus telephonicus]|uniref:TetR/AcrR family transcriptional regulator n=1 Tax=Lysinibacillus telephonicus TaxID=1714840 RepID=UPI00163ADCFE|nr:TetR/AcrR family transcriptional regulator C-terminal domain-containing protein [Lysinibacillus telephonicus]